MNLLQALRLPPAVRLALVGAGGKTGALFSLARRLSAPAADAPRRSVLVTTTTHLALEQLALADHHFTLIDPIALADLAAELPPGVLLFTGLPSRDGRASGLSGELLQALRRLADDQRLPLLIEADGARRRPLKAPAAHEPALPDFVDTMLVVAGLAGLGQPLADEWVHRPERFAALSRLELGAPVTPAALARVLAHPQGGLKGLPPGARPLALLNQAATPTLQAQAAAIAAAILPPFAAVVIGDCGEGRSVERENETIFAVHEAVAGIVLAAGGSTRLGQPKQLLEWRGQPLVRHAVRAALRAGLAPVVVVTGANGERVWQAAKGQGSEGRLQRAHNEDWASGQSSSVQAGLQALPRDCGAAIFLLSDQPQVTPALLRALVERHAATLAPVVAPLAGGRRANPVLFDRVTFTSLAELRGDTGGRAIFARYPPEYVEWLDEAVLLDVDTPEDYQRLEELDV